MEEETDQQQSDADTRQSCTQAHRAWSELHVTHTGQKTGTVLGSKRGHTLRSKQDAREGDGSGDSAGPGTTDRSMFHPHHVAFLQLVHVVTGVEGCVPSRHLRTRMKVKIKTNHATLAQKLLLPGCIVTILMYLSMTGHFLLPLHHEVPNIVVVTPAELGSKYKLVDARDRSSEYAWLITIALALVHHLLIEDDRVVFDLSQAALVRSVKQNSRP